MSTKWQKLTPCCRSPFIQVTETGDTWLKCSECGNAVSLPAKTIEQLAGELAGTVFYHVSDHMRAEYLRDLLIQFAEEIQRRSVEP